MVLITVVFFRCELGADAGATIGRVAGQTAIFGLYVQDTTGRFAAINPTHRSNHDSRGQFLKLSRTAGLPT